MGNLALHGLVWMITSFIIAALLIVAIIGIIKTSIHDIGEKDILDAELKKQQTFKIRNPEGGIHDISRSKHELTKDLKGK